jgi:hypothetical protein
MSTKDYLYQAKAALSALGYIARYHDNDTTLPPADFGFGLSIIFSYIKDDVTAAYNGLTEPKEQTE